MLCIALAPDPYSQAENEIKLLIDSEASLALSNSRDDSTTARYGALFTANAWIADSGPPVFRWQGREKIMARFRGLPRFAELRHKLTSGPSIDGGKATAEATTEFLLEKAIPNKNPNGSGKEHWVFVKEGEQWKILTFRYNIP